jgi:hypothetical protein
MKVRDIQRKAADVGTTVGERARDSGKALIIRTEGPRRALAERTEGPRKAIGKRTKETRRVVGYWIAGEKPKRRTLPVLGAAAAGAVAAFFLDPVNGKRRRSVARDKALSAVRGVQRRVGGKAQDLERQGEGLQRELVDRNGDPVPDSTLTRG